MISPPPTDAAGFRASAPGPELAHWIAAALDPMLRDAGLVRLSWCQSTFAARHPARSAHLKARCVIQYLHDRRPAVDHAR